MRTLEQMDRSLALAEAVCKQADALQSMQPVLVQFANAVTRQAEALQAICGSESRYTRGAAAGPVGVCFCGAWVWPAPVETQHVQQEVQSGPRDANDCNWAGAPRARWDPEVDSIVYNCAKEAAGEQFRRECAARCHGSGSTVDRVETASQPQCAAAPKDLAEARDPPGGSGEQWREAVQWRPLATKAASTITLHNAFAALDGGEQLEELPPGQNEGSKEVCENGEEEKSRPLSRGGEEAPSPRPRFATRRQATRPQELWGATRRGPSKEDGDANRPASRSEEGKRPRSPCPAAGGQRSRPTETGTTRKGRDSDDGSPLEAAVTVWQTVKHFEDKMLRNNAAARV